MVSVLPASPVATCLCTVLTLSACTEPPESFPHCKATRNHLRATIEALDGSDLSASVPAHASAIIPVTDGGRVLVELGGLLSITEDEVTLDGRTLGPLDAPRTGRLLRADLETLNRVWKFLHPDIPRPAKLLVAAKADEPAGPMLRLLATVSTSYDMRLLVAQPRADEPEAPAAPGDSRRAALRAELHGASPARLAEAMSDAFGTCKPLFRFMHRLREVRAPNVGATFVSGLLDAAKQCDCADVDFPAVETLAVLMTRGFGPRIRWFPIVLRAQHDRSHGPTVDVSPGDTTSDLASTLSAADTGQGPISLELPERGVAVSSDGAPRNPVKSTAGP